MPNPKILLSVLAASVALAGAFATPVMAQSAKPKTTQKFEAKAAKPRAAKAKVSRVCAPGQVRKAGRCASRDSVADGSLRHPIILMPGQRFESAMPAMANPAGQDLPPLDGATYYQIGNRVISVDNESRVIMNVMDAAGG